MAWARALAYLGVCMLVGEALAQAWLLRGLESRPSSRWKWLALGFVLLGTGLEVESTVRELADGWNWPALATYMGQTRPGQTALARVCLAPLLLVRSRGVLVLTFSGLVGSFALTSHAGASESWPLFWVDAAHLTAVLVWAGPLLYLAASSSPQKAVERFSNLALPAFALLVIFGGALAWSHVGSWQLLRGSSYGWRLLAKLGFVFMVIFVAGINRCLLLPKGSAAALRAGLLAEAALVLAILACTGFLVTSDLPQST